MSTNPADALRDPARLAALHDTGLPDAPPEEAFDRLTRLAARLLGAEWCTLSLVDEARQFFLSHAGLPSPLAEARGTPAEHSICQYVVRAGEPVVIADAARDPRVRDTAMVTRHGVRAYAGVPVSTREGLVLGSLCVCAREPRAWAADELEALADLAALASAEVDRRREGAARVRAAEALREAEAWFRSLVEQSIAGIYVFQDGRFRYVNPRFAQVFGYPVEAFGSAEMVARVVHPDDLPLVEENLRRRLDGEVSQIRYAFRGVRSDGTILYLEVHGARAVLGGRPAVIGVGVDVTDRVRAEHERAAALAARDRFYAMLSHELRTPISTIMLYNDLLLSGLYEPVSEAQREAVERSQKSARHLLELINDLLDLSKLEAGKMEARLEEVEVAELVDGVFTSVGVMAAEHGCSLSLELGARPLPVTGDARRIRQILLNLLSNAVKYGRGRPVEVRCGPVEGGVAIEVTDHGPGIAAADVPRIFEEFVTLGGSDSDVGTGLGLPIARRLTELLGGRLDVLSTPGEGSTFRVFLPDAGHAALAGARG